MEHTHYFRNISDAHEFIETHPGSFHRSNGVVVIPCDNQEELDRWQDWEEFGPFPCDRTDMR